MYNFIDNYGDAIVGVYGGYVRPLPFDPAGQESNPGPINAEHTVPQSFFDRLEPMRSDLHHLFPTYSRWNSTRQNYPCREIPDDETTKWMLDDDDRPDPPPSDERRPYSEYANRSFEPPEDHKGNVARAIFYFFTMYPDFDISRLGDINTLYAWHLVDSVDDRERERNNRIEGRQGNRNPYVDHEDWVLRAWPIVRVDEVAEIVEAMGGNWALLGTAGDNVVSAKPADEIRVHSLNVGSGSCHIIECPGNSAPILYDCGRTSRSFPDMTDEEVVNYAASIFNQYDAAPIVIVSHGDRDHNRYIPAVMGDRLASTVWFGGHREGHGGVMRDWFAFQENNDVQVVGDFDDLPAGFFNNGQPVPALQCGQASTRILTVNEGNTKNARSLVARIEHGDFSVTLTGDATGETESGAIENFVNLETTLLDGRLVSIPFQ